MIFFRTQAEELFGDRRRVAPWVFWVVPLTALAGILFLDLASTGVILTPLLSLTTLAALAFFLPPLQMTFWAGIYCVVVCVVFWVAYFGSNSDPTAETTVYVRTGSFLIGAIVTVVLCGTRSKARGQFDALRRVFEKMPVAVVISDASGLILFANGSARDALKVDAEGIRGQSIFSLGSETQKKGDRIQSYLELCDHPGRQHESVLLLGYTGKQVYRCMQSGIVLLGCPCVMTTLVQDRRSDQEMAPGQ